MLFKVHSPLKYKGPELKLCIERKLNQYMLNKKQMSLKESFLHQQNKIHQSKSVFHLLVQQYQSTWNYL